MYCWTLDLYNVARELCVWLTKQSLSWIRWFEGWNSWSNGQSSWRCLDWSLERERRYWCQYVLIMRPLERNWRHKRLNYIIQWLGWKRDNFIWLYVNNYRSVTSKQSSLGQQLYWLLQSNVPDQMGQRNGPLLKRRSIRLWKGSFTKSWSHTLCTLVWIQAWQEKQNSSHFDCPWV